eukprot:12200552-Prorocentrum_lima.AAC.1
MWIGAVARLLREQTIVARLGTHETEPIPLGRGLIQGTTAAPALFCTTLDKALRRAKARWETASL